MKSIINARLCLFSSVVILSIPIWIRSFHGQQTVVSDQIDLTQNSPKLTAAYFHNRDKKTAGKIPRIIHQHWEDYRIPDGITLSWITSWLGHNPEWEYWFWSVDDVRCFLQREYPWFLPVYNAYNKGSAKGGLHRGDAMRYFILYHFGGLYADLDMECLRPLDVWSSHECVIPEETLEHVHIKNNQFIRNESNLINAIMLCSPNNSYMKLIMESLEGTSKMKSILDATGPFMITKVYEEFIKQRGNTTGEITRGDYKYFVPTYDPGLHRELMRKCHDPVRRRRLNDQGRKTCQQWIDRGYRNVPGPEAYTNHHWFHMSDFPTLKDGRGTAISNLVPKYKTYRKLFGHCEDA